MDVLLTGNLSAVTQELSNQLCGEHRLILSAKKLPGNTLHKKTVTFTFEPKDEMFPKLFKSYNFGAVVFLSARGETENKLTGTLDELDIVLKLCSENKISQVIYVSSGEVYQGMDNIWEGTAVKPATNTGHLLASAESLCSLYKEKTGLNTLILRVPYLYGDHFMDCFASRAILDAFQKKAVDLPGSQEQMCDFLKDVDLAKLIKKILEGGYNLPEGAINLGSGKPISFGEFGNLLQSEFPECKITYGVNPSSVPAVMESDIPRKQYDWIPYYSLSEEFSDISKKITSEAPPRRSFWASGERKSLQTQNPFTDT